MPFTVEWQGKEVTVFVAREVIEVLGRHTGGETDADYLKTFDRFRGSILDGVREAIQQPKNIDKQGRLVVRSEYVRDFS